MPPKRRSSAPATLTPPPVLRTKLASRYKIARTIGMGTFGRVILAKGETGWVAVKCVSKKRVKEMVQVEHTINERRVLAFVGENSSHPATSFIVSLKATFQDDYNIYMAMEYVPGGELFEYLKHIKIFPDHVTKFCAAQIVLALSWLHGNNIIYRDLKPENILIDQQGYIKLTDFGFAKPLAPGEISYTMCGTPEYIAPEMVAHRPHSKAVDWWTLGILLHEMLLGHTPFRHPTQNEQMDIYRRIDAFHPKQLNFGSEGRVQSAAIDLITKLLEPDVSRRWGNLRNGSADVQIHPWFAAVNWQGLCNRTVISPFKPHIEWAGDARNFLTYPEEDVSIGSMVDGEPVVDYGDIFAEF